MPRAQRLSASEIRHAPKKEVVEATPMCSTPFGIRDSTPSPVRGFKTIADRAQRLSASEIRHRTSGA